MSLRILFCRSNPIQPDPRVEKEAFALSEAGYDVDVVAWDRDGIYPVRETLTNQRNGSFSVFRLRVRSKYGTGLQNLPNLLRWQASLLWWLLVRGKRYELIHACDFDTVVPSWICALVYGKKIIYDIFDFYADHLRNTPAYLISAIRKADLWIIGKADAVIIADENRKTQIERAKPKRTSVICNTPEDIGVASGNVKKIRGFSVVYVGLLQMERGLSELVNVFQAHPDWHLDLAGFGGDEIKLLDLIVGLDNVSWHGRVSYSSALELARNASVLIATYDPSIPNHRFSSPNKLFEAMMLGKPLIASRGTGFDTIVEKMEMGLVVNYGDVQALEVALIKLSENNNFVEAMGRNARQAYEAHYSWEIMRNSLLMLYRDVLALENRAESRLSR
jgi:glycosyltransferase involved in cell wall biosynthesis